MIKNKNASKLCDFSSKLSATNISKMLITINIIKNINNFIILENSDSEFMNLEISKQKLKNL